MLLKKWIILGLLFTPLISFTAEQAKVDDQKLGTSIAQYMNSLSSFNTIVMNQVVVGAMTRQDAEDILAFLKSKHIDIMAKIPTVEFKKNKYVSGKFGYVREGNFAYKTLQGHVVKLSSNMTTSAIFEKMFNAQTDTAATWINLAIPEVYALDGSDTAAQASATMSATIDNIGHTSEKITQRAAGTVVYVFAGLINAGGRIIAPIANGHIFCASTGYYTVDLSKDDETALREAQQVDTKNICDENDNSDSCNFFKSSIKYTKATLQAKSTAIKNEKLMHIFKVDSIDKIPKCNDANKAKVQEAVQSETLALLTESRISSPNHENKALEAR